MKWCYIYRSPKKENSYLYIDKENDFSEVPDVLMKAFGQPVFVMKILLNGKRALVVGSSQDVEEKIARDGFFFQMLNDNDFYVDNN